MKPFEVYIIYVSWGVDGKTRPVLVYTVSGVETSVFIITSRYDNKSEAIKSRYFRINDWREAGLKRPSFVDIGTKIKLPISAFEQKPIGGLTDDDKIRFIKFLTTLV